MPDSDTESTEVLPQPDEPDPMQTVPTDGVPLDAGVHDPAVVIDQLRSELEAERHSSSKLTQKRGKEKQLEPFRSNCSSCSAISKRTAGR